MNGHARASEAWYAYDDTVLAPKGSGSMKRVGTSRVERSVVIRILLLMGPSWAQAYELPYTGSHIHVYSSAACLRLPSAAAHSAAAARAAADAVAAIRDSGLLAGLYDTCVASKRTECTAACLLLLTLLRLPLPPADAVAAAAAYTLQKVMPS